MLLWENFWKIDKISLKAQFCENQTKRFTALGKFSENIW